MSSIESSSSKMTKLVSNKVTNKPYLKKSTKRPLFTQNKAKHIKSSTKGRNGISYEITLNNLEITEATKDLNSSFSPLMSSSEIMNKTIDVPTPPAPPPLPDFFQPSTNKVPPPPPLPNELFSSPFLTPPPPPPLPNLLIPTTNKKTTPASDFLKELQEMSPQPAKNSQKPEKKTSTEFDLNEIKTFKFKTKSKSPLGNVKRHQAKANPWDSLMNEIRTNPCEKLKKVDGKSGSKHRKLSADNLDLANFQGSQLIRDLNLILNQRSQFFNDHDDENDSSDEWDCSDENLV